MSRTSKIAFAIWLVFALLLTGATGWQFWRGLPIETDLLAMLPRDERKAELSSAISAFQDRLGERTLVLVGVPQGTSLEEPVGVVCKTLRDSGAFAEVTCERHFDPAQTFELIASHRWQLADPQVTAVLEKGDAKGFLDDAQAQLFSPLGRARAAMLMRDPLGLAMAALARLERPGVSIDPDSRLASVEGEGRVWAIIDARNKHGAFGEGGPEPVVESYRKAASLVGPNVELLGMGVAFHAAAAAKSAKQEVSTIGVGSWLGSILLVLFVFRNVRSLLLASLAIGLGMAAGLLATIAVFGHVHVVTLVLGSSLAGVAIDYTLHVLSDSFRSPTSWRGEEAVARLRWPLFLGMATSVVAYASLAVTPFPGLRELALFATAALSTSFVTVIAAFPVLLIGYRAWSGKPREVARSVWVRVETLFAKRALMRAAVALGVLLSAIGLAQLSTDDDIHSFQTPAPAVAKAEQRARALFSSAPESQFYLVTGQSADDVLSEELKLRSALDEVVGRGELGSYQMLSQHVPPRVVQMRNLELFRQHVYGSTALASYFDELGFSREAIEAEQRAFASAKEPLSVETWLASAPGEADRMLWLGQTSPGVFSSVVLLHELSSTSSLSGLERERAVLVDRASEISILLARSRTWALAMLGAAFLAMWLLLALRYGRAGAFRTLLPTAMACVVALAGAGWLHLPLNIFSTVALWLVLGMGVDYAIFFHEAGEDLSSASIGVLVDSATTLMSFGLLALSATPALRAFGTVLTLGLASAFLFAPLARSSRPHAPVSQ